MGNNNARHNVGRQSRKSSVLTAFRVNEQMKPASAKWQRGAQVVEGTAAAHHCLPNPLAV